MRVVLADDEPIALQRLALSLAPMPDIEIVGQARDGQELIDVCEQARPDLVLLDVHMPGQDGVSAALELSALDHPPLVIFVTAFQEHAIEAFEVNAVDFLTKPFRLDRLELALKRARERASADAMRSRLEDLKETIAQLQDNEGAMPIGDLWIRIGGERVRLNQAHIERVEAERDYVHIVHNEGVYTLRETIKAWEAKLTSRNFVRVHRSFIVNAARVKRISRRAGRPTMLTLIDGKTIPVGPNYLASVLARAQVARWRT